MKVPRAKAAAGSQTVKLLREEPSSWRLDIIPTYSHAVLYRTACG